MLVQEEGEKFGTKDFESGSVPQQSNNGKRVESTEGVDEDLRPHYNDPVLKQSRLVDSGSQVTAFPPEPGDIEDKSVQLRAVNGSKIKTFGHKIISIKIGRKTYPFKAIKAEVDKPVLGWDFMRCHKLDLRWGEFGDLFLYDQKAKIQGLLDVKALPKEMSDRHHKLAVLEKGGDKESNLSIPFMVAAMQVLDEPESFEEVEDIDVIPDSPYKEILKKYPDLLKQSFSSETEDGIQHKIPTGDATPCKAKLRRLLPGSPKAIKAKEAFMQLVKLGIVEKVDPETPNTWSSPIHFVVKPDGSLRPVGDYRALNAVTELDHYRLPHLKDYTHEIAGAKVFSKVDLRKAFHLISIDKKDRHKTCVTTPWGMYNFKRLSMGMSNSAQAFQRYIDSVIADIPGCFAYLDDLLLYSKDTQSHLQLLDTVFSKLAKAGLVLALSKCQFGQSSLDYLGYRIDSSGLVPLPRKVEALQKFPHPTKQKELLAYLGGS